MIGRGGELVQGEVTPGKGIPLGNQAGSWFAIAYLDSLDWLIKERQRFRYYSRYMDNGVVVHQSKEYLQECLNQMHAYLAEERALDFNQKTQMC